MTGPNKILTVSYGTFSCTLEGFDDPFGTMRGIAEYFRDLAADDRYFGAEPPTPDVEMLQNIAQKEVQRRVEARVGETGIALTQVEDAADAPAPPVAEPKPAPAPEPAPQVEEAETLDSGPLAFDDEYLMADEPEDVLTVDTDAAPVEDTLPVESVAEKLRRIRAVVSKSIEAEEPQEPFDPAPAEAGDAGADDDTAEIRSRALTETIASITADLSDEFDSEEDEDQPTTDGVPAADSDFSRADDEADLAAIAQAEDEAAHALEPAPVPIANILTETDGEDSEQEDIAAGNAFETIADRPEAIDDEGAHQASDDDASTAEDDAAIVASVGKIVADETETEDTYTTADAVTEAADQPDTEHPQRTSAPLAPIQDSNGDVGRLLEETDNKLNEDEGTRRRRVISQMRAAVAATKADRIFSKIVSREATDVEEQTPYRNDLDHAISRKPVSKQPGAAQSDAPRSAPLVLVSSQRVDGVEDKAAVASDRPQSPEKPVGDILESASFKDFATKMGATELPDLLEAAAAYSAFVEGEPHFSRPEIMKRVARFDPARQLSRETGLRTFGQLLRQGKIQKLQRGQFIVADDTKFNPAQRIAGE